MPRKLYKVLVDGRSCHGGSMEWSLPVRDPATGKYRPGSWQRVSGPLSMCESGIHLTTKPENWLTFGCQIFRAQPDSEPTQWYDDKCVVAGARLLYPVRKPAYWTQVEQFIGSIQSVPFFKPDGRPEPEWKLFTAGTWKAALEAAREAAKNAARTETWDAARAEAWGAAWDAARNTARGAIWDAVWYAARNAVKAAAGGADAARNTTSGAIWDAVCVAERDARLMASLHVCGPLAETHAQHIKARWRVWQKGYALLCDVGGALYVYAAEESER